MSVSCSPFALVRVSCLTFEKQSFFPTRVLTRLVCSFGRDVTEVLLPSVGAAQYFIGPKQESFLNSGRDVKAGRHGVSGGGTVATGVNKQ